MNTLYDLTEMELFYLLRDNLYPDILSWSDDSGFFSEQERYQIQLECRTRHSENFSIEENKYNSLLSGAVGGFTPVYILSTPLGIWQFNLDELPDTNGALNIWLGRQILGWYPEFSSEAEWFAHCNDEFAEVTHEEEYDEEELLAFDSHNDPWASV